MLNLTERFWTKVQKTDDCWLWLASKDRDGYGLFTINGKRRGAHAVAYELTLGEVPIGLELDHTCRNRKCVNPSHLEPVTHKVNVLRGCSPGSVNAAKTHCMNGHEFNKTNTQITPRGSRFCRACNSASVKKYKLKKKQRAINLIGETL